MSGWSKIHPMHLILSAVDVADDERLRAALVEIAGEGRVSASTRNPKGPTLFREIARHCLRRSVIACAANTTVRSTLAQSGLSYLKQFASRPKLKESTFARPMVRAITDIARSASSQTSREKATSS